MENLTIAICGKCLRYSLHSLHELRRRLNKEESMVTMLLSCGVSDWKSQDQLKLKNLLGYESQGRNRHRVLAEKTGEASH